MKVRDYTLVFTEIFTKATHYIRIKLSLATVTKTVLLEAYKVMALAVYGRISTSLPKQECQTFGKL